MSGWHDPPTRTPHNVFEGEVMDKFNGFLEDMLKRTLTVNERLSDEVPEEEDEQ